MSKDYIKLEERNATFSSSVINGSSKDYFLSEQYVKKVFLNEYSMIFQIQKGFCEPGKTRTMIEDNHLVEYRINNALFRGDDFKSGTKIVFGGCSHTYGIGLHENLIWPDLVSKKLNNSYANLASPGAAVNESISNLFKYFSDYGNPEVLFCLFPGLDNRFQTSINGNLYKLENFNSQGRMDLRTINDFVMMDFKNAVSYSKRPHNINDVISGDMVYLISIRFIQMLEQYCKSNNIKFLWGVWDLDNQNLLKYVSKKYNIFNGFVPINFQIDDKDNPCHQDLKLYNEDVFYKALDRAGEKSHFGSHMHQHIAEAFLLKYEGNK